MRRGILVCQRRILNVDRDEKYRGQSHRQIGEEDPTPIVGVGTEAAQYRFENGSDGLCDRGEAKCASALFRWKRVENDRLLGRLQAAGEKAL